MPDVVLQQTHSLTLQAKRIVLGGQVQGVGFRPYIYRYAQLHGLAGWVRNTSGRVEIHVQGTASQLDKFEAGLIAQAPVISQPHIESNTAVAIQDIQVFRILDSYVEHDADIHLPVDLCMCEDCKTELDDPSNRRHRYPFINCTQCGPRYTLIKSLPYDRVNTSMAGFTLCTDCAAEYSDVSNRRYHAEPVACEVCGPALTYKDKDGAEITGNEAALQACIKVLKQGGIIAIKGVGGYHLVCDARNDEAVLRLRHLKPRPDKPLAIMFPEAQLTSGEINNFVELSNTERGLLQSARRPIVLASKARLQDKANSLSPGVAPGMDTLGVMLPYSPLHHLLLNDFSSPLVMTSANISGEPVLTDNNDVEQRLSHVVDAYLHHNRDIVRPADDSVYRVIQNRPRPLRPGRGCAPLEIELPFELDVPVLAVGGHMKNTIALGWGNRVVISPHIGEMNNKRSLQTFENCVTDLQKIYQVKAEIVLCDAHSGYQSTRWAMQQHLPVHRVYHHRAHASVAWYEAYAEMDDHECMLAFTWDGVGLGPDDTLWGGDALLGRAGEWQRVAHFRPFKLPGGERAGREPWRSAVALCWESDAECSLPEARSELLYSFWQQGRNAPLTTSAGRLYDAAAALVGICREASFEGQGPMYLEAIADQLQAPVMLDLTEENGCLVADWQPLLAMLQDTGKSPAQRAACFHNSMATGLLAQALRVRENTGVNVIGLSGGVFQNRVLSERVFTLLEENNFKVIMPEVIPVNDAGISFGQIMEYVGMQSSGARNG